MPTPFKSQYFILNCNEATLVDTCNVLIRQVELFLKAEGGGCSFIYKILTIFFLQFHDNRNPCVWWWEWGMGCIVFLVTFVSLSNSLFSLTFITCICSQKVCVGVGWQLQNISILLCKFKKNVTNQLIHFMDLKRKSIVVYKLTYFI